MLGKSQPPSVWLLSSSLPPPPIRGQAGVDCEGGGAPEFLYRGLPRGRKRKATYPPGNSRAALAPSGFTRRSSGPEQRKGSVSPYPDPFC